MHKAGKVSVSSFSKEYFFLFSDSKLNIIIFGVLIRQKKDISFIIQWSIAIKAKSICSDKLLIIKVMVQHTSVPCSCSCFLIVMIAASLCLM